MSDDLDKLRTLIQTLGIKTRKHHGHLFSRAEDLDWLVHLRDVFLCAEGLRLFAEAFWDKFADHAPLQIGGVETSGIPLVAAILLVGDQRSLCSNGFIVRKERKVDGLERTIEGVLNDDPIIIIDDSLNSGRTLERARVCLKKVHKSVESIFVAVDFQSAKGMQWRESEGLKVHSLFNLQDFGLYMRPPGKFALDQRSSDTLRYEPIWEFTAPGGVALNVVPKSAPCLANGSIYFGSEAGVMWGLDAKTGKPVWNFEVPVNHTKGIWSSPCVHMGRIYFGAYNGNVYCLDAESGELIWASPVCEWIGSSPLVVERHGLLVIGLEYERPEWKGSNVALDLETGEKVWEHWMAKYQHGSPAYWEEGDLIISGSSDHAILAQKADSGEVVWSIETKRSIKYAPIIDKKRKIAACASFDGSIRIVSLEKGELLAEFPTDDICYTTPLLTKDRLFCGSGDRCMYVVDLDSLELLKKIETRGRIYSSPKLVGNNVIFGNSAGILEEIDQHSLATKQAVMFPEAITNAVAVSPDEKTIYVPTFMNEIYAISRVVDGE